MVRETRYLWIGNLPHTIREDRILEHFKRYGKVQSVKILPKKEEETGACATVAFIDIKSASKAHNADNKIDDRTLKTDYYEPPASSTASSAIYIHERDDALVRPAPTPYTAGRTPRYGLSEERNYERPGHYYGDREPYMRRPIGLGYHDEDNYQGRAKSRDRYSRSAPGNNYTEGAERNQNHFRPHNARQHFDPQRYPVGDQYSDEREPATSTSRLNRRTNNTPATPAVASVASPTTIRTENRPRRTKRRSPSRTPSGSRSNSGSRSRSQSSSGSRSSSSSSKLRSSSSDSSGRSRSPSKSRSPVSASYGSQNNTKGSRLDRPSSAIANPSSTVCYLPSAVNTSAINCTSNNSQGSTPSQSCTLPAVENHCDREEKRPLGICVRNLPVRSTDTSLKDGLFHEYKKHGKVTMVKVIGQGTDRYAVVCFKKPEDVEKALEVSKDKLFFGCKIEVTAHEGLDAEDNEFRPLEAELDEFHPKATRTLFIGNLEKDITTPELRKHFDQFGEIIEIDIKKQGSATSYAFIQYSDIASVVKAMRKLDGENLGANRIKLGFGKSMPTNCVWLDGIVDSVSDKFLARHFSRFGIVAYTAVDREKGHALVFYENVEFAQIAVSEMRGRILQGKKLQVDFASRECQTTFFDKLEMTGQMLPGDGTRPWERRERRVQEFEAVRNDDREPRVGFENRVYPRYEGQPRPPRGNFRGGQRAGFSSRGRGQGFSARYEVYHDEFGERRHRYNSREENVPEVTMFDGKIERPKYVEGSDCPNRKRNKLRNSISDQESHHSQSPPRSCHQSRSTSPVSKDRKSLKERLHHRIKSPGSHNSSLVNSPCRDVSDDMETNSDYRDSRSKSDTKTDEVITDLSYASPRSSCEKDVTEKVLLKGETDSLRSRSSLDAESADESCSTSDQLGQLERKKRLLASSSLKGGKDLNNTTSKCLGERGKGKIPNSHVNSLKPVKVNCISNDAAEDNKCDTDNAAVQQECTKDKPHQTESANTDLKYLQKKQVQILHLLEQLGDNANSSDAEGVIDGERLALKKHRSPSTCSETNSLFESDSLKSLTKEECGIKLCKSGIKDPAIFTKLKSKADAIDSNNCISLSLDSFIFQKHLDPRKGCDQHSISMASVNSLQKCRRISVDNETCLPIIQGANDSFLCAPSPITTDVSWKKECNSISDIHFSDSDGPLSISHLKLKEENISDDDALLSKKLSFPLDLPNRLLTLRTTISDMRHEVKRERDISPLSLPLPKFAASLRSPKSSPSVLTSPKSTTAHSPRAGLSPSSYASGKNIRVADILQDLERIEKKVKDPLSEEKVNGASVSPLDSISPFESQAINEAPEPISHTESIQSPKSNCEKIKESHSSSESESSPCTSPNRPSIEDRIKALDEKFNAWSGSTRTSVTTPDAPPVSVPEVPKCPIKRSRFNFLAPEMRNEPSEIVKSILARSTIFDQDSKRLQHIDEKYEPLNIKVETSPKVKPTFRTKAAAKEFSTPIAPAIQTFNQSSLAKNSSSILVAQGIMSPPATPQSASILSPVTPPLQSSNAQLTPQVFTPCSPRPTPFGLTSSVIKNPDNINNLEKDLTEHVLKSPTVFNSVKPKSEPNFHVNSAVLATSLKSPLHCPIEVTSHAMILSSPPTIKKEPSSPTDSATETVCKFEIDCKVPMKKEVPVHNNVTSIPLRKDGCVSLTKDHLNFNSFDHDKKEFCDSKDPRLSYHEGSNHWRENGCKDEIKVNIDSCAKSFTTNPSSDTSINSLGPATKKRVSSIDSTESESSKSVKSLDSSRDSQEINWSKHEKPSEPEPKKPKLSKSSTRERSSSPPAQSHPKKIEKKEKTAKPEKSKASTSKSNSSGSTEKSNTKSNKSEYKDKTKTEHKSKEEKRSKSRDSKESTSNKEQRTKSRERRNSEKDNKNLASNNPTNKSKKEPHTVKSETKHEIKNESKCESKTENKKESKHESKHESKSDNKHDNKHKNRNDNKHENKNDNKTENKNNESENESKSEDAKCEKKHSEKKSSKKSSSSSSSLLFDFQAFMDDEPPVYFSMYDKVKARSSKSQTLKHQTSDLESVRQKFSKLKQSRAKREEKTKSIDQDSDKDSDSGSHHSSESDSQAKSTKVKQPRKRKLVIESSSDDDAASHDSSSRISKMEKDFNDSATDSDFEYNVSRRQSSSLKVRKKKADVLNSDSSDSDSNFLSKSQTSSKKKSTQSRSKHRPEKSKKIIKSDYEMSDLEIQQKTREKDMKTKKVKKEKPIEVKQESESMEYETSKKAGDDSKMYKKKISKECKQEPELSSQKKVKSDHTSKEKSIPTKERKMEGSVEKMQVDDGEKHKPYSKKRKKSKKMSKNKEKRTSCDKTSQDSSRKLEDIDARSSLPVLSPKPSNPLPDKQLSPPCLQAGAFSDNDFKSDFSDFDFEVHQPDDVDINPDLWKQLDTKSDSNSDKSAKSKKKEGSKSQSTIIQSPEQDSSLPSFFDKLSDITDSETGRDPTDCTSDGPSDGQKHHDFSSKKEKESNINLSPYKNKHEKHEDQNLKQELNKYSDSHTNSSKEERRKKKSKKQSKERKKKTRDDKEVSVVKDMANSSVSASSPPKTLFENIADDEDSRISDIRMEEAIPEETRHFEQEFIAVTPETTTFVDDGPAKKEEKLVERRFEEEAAKETRRLEAELFSTARDSWHMKEKDYDPETSTGELCEEKHVGEIDSLTGKEENIFTGLDLHSSITEPSQNETDVFLSTHSESDPYKLDDKDVNEIEDQRKIEDDLAVSALLQEMQCGEISAPELTKETDYLDPLIETHPEDTMNYLLPDDGENSLHIADSSPEIQGNESQDEKLESSVMLLSPSSNSEPPALEISNVEDSVLLKIDTVGQTCITESLKDEPSNDAEVNKGRKTPLCYDFHEDSMEMCESKPPVIDIPIISDNLESNKNSVSPKVDRIKINKGKEREKQFSLTSKTDSNEDTDNESGSELAENQLTHFEDITMDNADSKDDDNPPILLPVESPRNLLSVVEPKDKVETVLAEESQSHDPLTPKPATEEAEEVESVFDRLSSDIDKQFGEILNRITEHPKIESKPFRISDPHVNLNISDLSDQNSNDSLLISNTGLFDSCHETSSVIQPYIKTREIDDLTISDNFNEDSNHCKYTLSESLNSTIDPPLLHYTNILNTSHETAVIQSPLKNDNDNDTISLPDKSMQNLESFTNEVGDTNAVSDTNQASSDSFLLDLFGPKSVENEIVENDSAPGKSKTDDDLISNSDSKNKNEDSDLSSMDNNHSSQTPATFEISEVNEQNEATEFNQEIFERSSDISKDSKLPQLLSFSSEQLFTELTNKPSTNISDNDIVNDNKNEMAYEDILPKVDENPKNEEIEFESKKLEVPEKLDEPEKFEEKSLDLSNEEPLNLEDSLDIKARPTDAESVCSDTTDITLPETKDIDVNQTSCNDEPIIEEIHPIQDIEATTKPKVERPRRGRRPKTRKYVETVTQKQEIIPEPTITTTRSSSRRVRPTSTSSERVRRSLRSDTAEATIIRDFGKKRYSIDENVHSETEDLKKDVCEEISDGLVSDTGTMETELGSVSSALNESNDQKSTEKIQTKNEEPRRRRGRRKKGSNEIQNPLPVDKSETKPEDTEFSKEFHRPKSWLSLLSSEKEQKSAKDNSSSNAYDVFEFREEEDENVRFESLKERLHDTSRNITSTTDSKHDKVIDQKHDKVIDQKQERVNELKNDRTSDQKHDRVSDQKHDKVSDQKHERVSDQKHERVSDQKHERVSDQKHERVSDQKHERVSDQKHERVSDQKHDRVSDQKHDKVSDQKHDQKHDKSGENIHEKEKRVEETSKIVISDDRDTSAREPHTEAKEHRKISITIRFHPKDGHDGTSPGTAEVVKTSEALNIEEVKPEPTKTEKGSTKHDVPATEIPYNGPCKSTRKSTRLMNQALRSTVDEVIEDVVKGNFKETNSSQAEPIPTRVTRRSRSNRRSEENLSRELVPSENSDDTTDDKNKNEPVFFIHDNAVKDIPEEKKKVSSQPTEATPVADVSTPESDKIPLRVASLRSYRITRSTASKLESNKDTSIPSLSSNDHHESQKKDNTPSNLPEEKTEMLQQKVHKEPKEAPKEVKIASESSVVYRPPLPVLKVEINRVSSIELNRVESSRARVTEENSKETTHQSEKMPIHEEDSNSASSTAVLIDPVTGFLTSVDKSEYYSEATNKSLSENKNSMVSDLSGISTSVLNIKSVSKANLPIDTVAATSVIQESSKSSHTNKSDNILVRAPLVQSLRSRQSSNSLPTAITTNTTSSSCAESKITNSPEKTIEPVKLPSKKSAVAASVLTIANSLTSSSSISTVAATEPVATVTSVVTTQASQGQSPVITGRAVPAISSPTIFSHDKKSDNVQAKTTHITHNYESPARTTAVVTSANMSHITSVSPTTQNKCSSSAITCITSSKSELPIVNTSATIPPTPVSEHISPVPSSKSLLHATSLPSEHSTLTIKQEVHATSSSSSLPSSAHNVPVASTWSSSKVTSDRITDSQAHMNTVQNSTSGNSTYSSKSETRSAKAIHSGKNNSAFTQQPAFPMSNYEEMLSGAHGLATASSGGVIAELLQNPQLLQQHKEFFAGGQLQDRNLVQMVRPTTPVASSIPPEIAARLGNPTPPHTPTPPVTSSNHSMPPTDIHPHVNSGLHIRHPSQPALIVPPHPSLGLHHSDINAFVHQQMIYAAAHNPYAAALHTDLRAQQEAQARAAAMGMNSRFSYHSIPPSPVVGNNFKQPSEPRHQPSVMDAKSEQKLINDLSKIIHETRGSEEKSQRSKSMRSKKEYASSQKEKEMKMMHSDREDAESSRLVSSHEKIPSTSAIAPHSLRQPQHAHYSSQILQMSPRLTVSPHERITDSPVVANLYSAGPGRAPQITLAGQVDDHKSESNIGTHPSHLYKSDEGIKPPLAHQSQPSVNPYHALEASVHPRQQLLSVPQIGSAATGHIDGRSSGSSHSPSSHPYKKESSHHNPASDKRATSEHSKKVFNARTIGHQGSSISPGPVGLPPAHSPLPWPAVIQSHSSHPSLAQSPHLMQLSNEPSSRRVNSHLSSQMRTEVPIHGPPPAHAMSQATNVPRLPQTPPHGSQVPSHGDQFLLQRYPVMWQGLLALKNDQAAVQMHFVSGNPSIARASLPPIVDGEASPVRIAQRMRLEPLQLEGVKKKIQMVEEHCVLMALPCGKDHMDVLQQSSNLKNGFINYLQLKQAAGIVNSAPPGCQQPAYVIHIFPSCDFTDTNLARIAPDLLQIICEITHLVIVIATV